MYAVYALASGGIVSHFIFLPCLLYRKWKWENLVKWLVNQSLEISGNFYWISEEKISNSVIILEIFHLSDVGMECPITHPHAIQMGQKCCQSKPRSCEDNCILTTTTCDHVLQCPHPPCTNHMPGKVIRMKSTHLFCLFLLIWLFLQTTKEQEVLLRFV